MHGSLCLCSQIIHYCRRWLAKVREESHSLSHYPCLSNWERLVIKQSQWPLEVWRSRGTEGPYRGWKSPASLKMKNNHKHVGAWLPCGGLPGLKAEAPLMFWLHFWGPFSQPISTPLYPARRLIQRESNEGSLCPSRSSPLFSSRSCSHVSHQRGPRNWLKKIRWQNLIGRFMVRPYTKVPGSLGNQEVWRNCLLLRTTEDPVL